MDWAMFWTACGAIASALSSLIVAVSIVILFRQVREAQKATYAQTFFEASARLQDEKLREDRGRVFLTKGKPLEKWTPQEIASAERVCHNYDTVGIMVRKEMLPKEIILDSWGDSLRKLWPLVRPLVEKYRRERQAEEFWDDFQWLAEEAEFFAQRADEARTKQRKRPAALPVNQHTSPPADIPEQRHITVGGAKPE